MPDPVGHPRPPFEDVRRIAVLRGGGLGDVLFAEPAMRALAARYPGARLTLLGTPLHVALFGGRSGPVHEVEVLPYAPGIREGPEDAAATDRFVHRMRRTGFDLAVQVHGGGRNSNPFLASIEARHTVGTATDDAMPLERTLPYEYYQHEVIRALEVAALAGAAPVSLEPIIEPTPEERRGAARYRSTADAPLVILHPGATDPRRRWPADRFADVAVRLVRDGCAVVVVGDTDDRQIADSIVTAAIAALSERQAGRVRSAAGELSLGELISLLLAAELMIGNDSGPRHLAAAVGVPTVGIYWVGNVINASPLSRSRHRIRLSWTTHCPECGADATHVGWTAPRCEHDVSFVADVRADDVYADARSLLVTARTLPPRDR